MPRNILPKGKASAVADILQPILLNIIDLTLQTKQAHWTLRGPGFLPLHRQLDEIVDAARNWSDDIAERLATLNIAPDGRPASVAKESSLPKMNARFIATDAAVSLISDRLAKVCHEVRKGIEATAKPDPVTQDLLIGIAEGAEKHLWLLQSHED